MRKDYILECCVDTADSAITAESCGVDRIELCSNLIIGGTTPTLALYNTIRERTKIKVHALIRPRFGDFLYQPLECEVIQKEVEQFRLAGADGVVIGCLTAEGSLDMEQMNTLVEAAGEMQITLHRAFDMCKDPFETLEKAISLGIHTILTSGQQDTALAGLPLLKQLYKAAGGRIQIMPGAGVNASVIREMLPETEFTSFHMSGKKIMPSKMIYRKENVHMGMPGISEYEVFAADSDALQKADAVLAGK